jgi:hypothetical protein
MSITNNVTYHSEMCYMLSCVMMEDEFSTLQRNNAKVLQQSQYKIATVTSLLHDDHNDLNTSILNDRHIYDVVV